MAIVERGTNMERRGTAMEMTSKPIPWMSLREKAWLYRARSITGHVLGPRRGAGPTTSTSGAGALVLQAELFWATAARRPTPGVASLWGHELMIVTGGISPADLAVFHLSPAVWLIRDLVQARVWEVT
jgi:hypothetical protein